MGRSKRTLEQCQEHARTKGGKCLALEYTGTDVKMQWQCAQFHIWLASADSVVRGLHWCKICGNKASGIRKRRSIQDYRALATIRGGKCLAMESVGTKVKIPWKCKYGHTWSAKYNSVQQGTWCVICANERKRQDNNLGIEKMHELAAKQFGKCHSIKYDNVNSILNWECAENHLFPMRVSNVIAGDWCEKCGKGLSERLCRAIMEHLYQVPFPSKRPDWLLNVTGKCLEFDGYNEDLALAFEYQGSQHFNLVHEFKVDRYRLEEIRQRDLLKVSICASRQVTLIQIPYTVNHNNLEAFIREELINRGRNTWGDLAQLNLWQLRLRRDPRFEIVKKKVKQKILNACPSPILGNICR